MRRWAGCVIFACAVSLFAAPVALASDGKISGDVINAAKDGVKGIEVRLFLLTEDGYSDSTDFTTNPGGDYSGEVEPGEYKVEFDASGSEYASQYYDDKLSLLASETIKVTAGSETSGIGATLFRSNTITGRVTSAASHDALGGIEATAYEARGRNAPVRSIDTNGFGEYDLSGLSRGEYVIGFRPVRTAHLDYAPQYYKLAPQFHEAQSLGVDEADTEEGADAELLQGASITGTVTDAANHQPLAGVVVYAVAADDVTKEQLELSESIEQVLNELTPAETVTNSSGTYTLTGLPTGPVDVDFRPANEGIAYTPQLYDDEPLAEGTLDGFADILEEFRYATPLELTAPSTSSGIDAAILRQEPANTVTPTVAGTLAAGQTLSCATGSWTGVGTLTYAYQWLRDGVAIAGASANTYVVPALAPGEGLSCEVTATNKIASASATSNTLTVPLPPSVIAPVETAPKGKAPVPAVVLSAAKILASASAARVPIACVDANCSGSIELTEQIVVKRRSGKRTTSKLETVVLADGSYSLSAGRSATVVIHLNHVAVKALAKAAHHQLTAELVASVFGGKEARRSIVLGAAVAKHT